MMDKDYYINKWLEGSISDEELKIFQSFDDYKELEKLSNAVQKFKAPEFDVDVELNRLQKEKAKQGKIVKMPWLNTFVRVAASFIIICAAFFYFYLNTETSRFADIGEKERLFLPDSSRIELNAVSTIAFKKRLWNINRKVTLDGEAFFDVAEGSKFDVYTSTGTVSVLGTEFNVKSRQDYFEVVCYEGRVGVESDDISEVLMPGQSIRILEGALVKKENLSAIKPSWIAGESTFNSTPFKEVIAELERQYSVTIEVSGVDPSKRFTGKFIHKNIDLALQAVTIPFDLDYRVMEDQKVVIKNRRN